jgi:hypothetical protein
VPVSVDIGHGDASLPTNRVGDACLVGDVLELIVALVPIEPVRSKVGREVKILQAIPIDITDRNSATVVVVEVVDDVEIRVLGELIGEADAGRFRGEQLEQRRGRGWRPLTRG